MSEALRKNPIHLRACILYEYAEGKSIFEAFQHFCQVLGEETMDYPEFEFWFQRFSTGETDLDYERGAELSTRTLTDMPMNVFERIVENLDLMDSESVINRARNRSRSPPENEKPFSSDDYTVDDQDESVLMYLEGAARTVENSNMKDSSSPKDLSDMPNDVVELIIERSDYKEQLILRKTSKSLRELVDKQTPALKTLSIHCDSDYIECSYNDQRFIYAAPGSEGRQFWGEYTLIVRDDYEKVAFDDLAFILKNPKLQLEVFEFGSSYHYSDEGVESFYKIGGRNWGLGKRFKKMQDILESINHQLSVKACNIDVTCLFTAMSFFPYLKPGVLEKIILREITDFSIDSGTMTEVARLDQWKQAKELQIKCVYVEDFPKEHTTHFKRFQIADCYIEDGIRDFIRDFILEHENVEFCSISNVGEEYLDATYIDTIGLTHVSPNLYHYTIPDSDHYLEFKITDKDITIEKKMKQ